MFLQLGDYKFEGLKTPQSWTGNFETNYGQIPIIDGKPVVQKISEKLNEFDITAQFRDDFCIPADEVDSLQLSRKNGEVLQLSSGEGVNYGRYVIVSINITYQACYSDGTPYDIQANIKLLEYNTTATTEENTGEAIESNNPVEEDEVKPLSSIPATLQSHITEGISISSDISDRTNASNVNYARISTLAQKASDAFDSANTVVESAKKIVYRAINLKNTLSDAREAAKLVKSASDIKDFTSLMSANTKLESAVYELRGASVPVATFLGSREGGK